MYLCYLYHHLWSSAQPWVISLRTHLFESNVISSNSVSGFSFLITSKKEENTKNSDYKKQATVRWPGAKWCLKILDVFRLITFYISNDLLENFHLHGLQMPPKKCLRAKRKCVPVMSWERGRGSAVCGLCPLSAPQNTLVLNCRRSFAWWTGWAPRLCPLTVLPHEGGGSVYKLKGRGDIKSFRLLWKICGSVADLWLMKYGPCFKCSCQAQGRNPSVFASF